LNSAEPPFSAKCCRTRVAAWHMHGGRQVFDAPDRPHRCRTGPRGYASLRRACCAWKQPGCTVLVPHPARYQAASARGGLAAASSRAER
jgi:hypothetical protein